MKATREAPWPAFEASKRAPQIAIGVLIWRSVSKRNSRIGSLPGLSALVFFCHQQTPPECDGEFRSLTADPRTLFGDRTFHQKNKEHYGEYHDGE